MSAAIGTKARCQACGREIVRVAVMAPFPHADWIHHGQLRTCPGPRRKPPR